MSVNFRRGAEAAEQSGSARGLSRVLSLPSRQKHELASWLLDHFGASNVTRKDDEYTHSCILPLNGHANGDRNPSASLNAEKLTYRCWSCGSGGLLWFVQTMTGLSQQEAVRFLLGEIDTSRVESLADLLEFIESTLSPKSTFEEPIPRYDARILNPWLTSMPEPLIDERKIARDNLVSMGVGHDTERDRAIIPHFWGGELVGWQSRRLDDSDGSPKYLSTPGLPKDTTLFNHDRGAQTILVVESPMTVVAKHHVGDLQWVATFGSRVTPTQIKHIARHPSVLLWMDNDPAGWLATEQLIDALLPLTAVKVVESYWEQDPADLPDDEVARLLDTTLPAALWQRPTGLLSSYREGRRDREHEEVRDRWEAGRHPGAAS